MKALKTFHDILTEGHSDLEKEDIEPGKTIFVISADGRSLSRYKIKGETELNVGTVLDVNHAHVAGDKIKKQKQISKDFVLGRKGNLKVYKNKKAAMKVFKRGEEK